MVQLQNMSCVSSRVSTALELQVCLAQKQCRRPSRDILHDRALHATESPTDLKTCAGHSDCYRLRASISTTYRLYQYLLDPGRIELGQPL